ncbi:hypothetical protein RDI58_002223 [Solanum bulbocastanum]|uniref:Uncharacterized protein n=1 Tax=Solanum bulbocastanum TaxID=147425 RepID=A0AAN8U6D4_SOLBU
MSAIWTHKDDSRMVNIVFISLNCNVCNYTYLKWVHTNTEEHSTLIFNCPSQLTTGGVNVIAAVVSIYYVDKLGMRLLFLEGGVQMLFCQVWMVND